MTGVRAADSSRQLGELARLLDAELIGDPSWRIRSVRPLATAGEQDLSFLTSASYRPQALESKAGALLIGRDTEQHGLCRNLILCEDPYLALAHLLQHLHPTTRPAPGIHPTAIVAKTAVVDEMATLGPYVVVGEETVVSADAVLWSHVAVGRHCFIGKGVVIHPHVAIYDRTMIEAGVSLHAGSVIGSDGFGYAENAGSKVKLPQVGRVVLEDNVEVGANSTIDRATLEETRIGAGTKIDNLVQVGHNVIMGKGCILCGQVGISGSTILGDGVVMGGQAGASGHLSIGNQVQVAGKSAVFQDVEDGSVVAGIPAQPISSWRRQVVSVNRIPDLRRRLAKIEERLAEQTINGDAPGGVSAGERESDE